MSTIIKVKRSSVQGKVPLTTDLELGEFAINTFDGKLFTKKNVNGTESIVDLSLGTTNLGYSANSTAVTVTSDTGNDINILGANSTVAGVLTAGAQTIAGAKTFTGDILFDAIGGDEGGEIKLAASPTGGTLAGSVSIDIYQNRLRIFENGGSNRGVYMDLTTAASSVGTNLLAGAGTNISISANTSTVTVASDTGSDGVILAANSTAAGVITTGTQTIAGVKTFTGDVTIADKIVHSGDTNTTIRFPAADTVTVETSGAERLRVDSVGNVGIGTASPQALLHVNTSTTATDVVRITNGTLELNLGVNNGAGGSYVFETTANALRFGTNNTERMRIDASGNLGLGVTPSAWDTPWRVLQLQYGASLAGLSGGYTVLRQNALGVAGGDNYISTGFATDYYQLQGQHVWRTAPSGTAGNAITFTQAMTLDASGNLGLGTTSPSYKLDVRGGVIAAGNGTIAGGISYSTRTEMGAISNHDLGFITNNTTRMLLTTAGDLGIGTSSPSVRLDVRDSIAVVSGAADSIAYFGNEDTTSTATTRITLRSHQGDTFRERTYLETGLDGVSGGYFSIWTRPTGTAITEKVRITGGGNVGIGTSSPASIVGGTDTSPVLSIGGKDASLTTGDKSGSLSFITNDSSYTGTYADGVTSEIASIAESSTGAAYGLAFYTGTITSSNRAERVRITREGNVGIGTSSPASKLDVNGTVTATAFAGPLTGNASTATALQTARTIALSGDVAGSATFDGSANVTITATIQANSVALGTDTTGNYVAGLTGGTGVTISGTAGEGWSPTVAIGQAVGTTSDVEFRNLVLSGNLTVNGTSTTVNATELAIEDNLIYLNEGSTITNPDIGIVGNYNDGTYAHTGVFRDATDGRWKFFKGYVPEPGQTIDTANATFQYADVQANTVYAALSGNATTATTLQTARNINGTSFNGSGNITTTNWGTGRTLTIGATGKSVNGSAAVAWSLAEIGAPALTGGSTFTGAGSFRGFSIRTSDASAANWSWFALGGTSDSAGNVWHIATNGTAQDIGNAGAIHIRGADGATSSIIVNQDHSVRFRSSSVFLGATSNTGGTQVVTNSGTWAIDTSGNAATASNSSLLNGISSTQLFNNMGNNHTTYTDANAFTNFGTQFLQGSTNGPGNGNSQWYMLGLGLGNDYAYSNYAMQFAIPRTPLGGNPYPAVRFREGGSWNSWSKIYAGYADSAGSAATLTTARTINGVSFNGSANITVADSTKLALTGGTLTGVLTIENTSDNQLLLQSADAWTGIGFNDGAAAAVDYIWHNGVNQTFAIGGGGANVSGKKLHVHGGLSVGSGAASTATPTNGIYSQGDVTVNGTLSAITKSFVIDHPTKEGMKLRYGSLEGPENGVYVRGRLKDNNIIELPDYWTELVDADSITVQLTPIGKHQKLYVEDIINNKVYVNNGMLDGKVNCFYYVLAERKDIAPFDVEYEVK